MTTTNTKRIAEIAPILCSTRTIEIFGEINTEMASEVITQLRLLAYDKPKEEIRLDVMSMGGEVHAGLAIIDAARTCGCPIRTTAMGICASMGAQIASCAGDVGRRYVMPNCELMIHQVMSGLQGQQSDIEIEAEHVRSLRLRLEQMLANACGHDVEVIHQAVDRNRWFSAQEAADFGLMDTVLTNNQAKDVLENRIPS